MLCLHITLTHSFHFNDPHDSTRWLLLASSYYEETGIVGFGDLPQITQPVHGSAWTHQGTWLSRCKQSHLILIPWPHGVDKLPGSCGVPQLLPSSRSLCAPAWGQSFTPLCSFLPSIAERFNSFLSLVFTFTFPVFLLTAVFGQKRYLRGWTPGCLD